MFISHANWNSNKYYRMSSLFQTWICKYGPSTFHLYEFQLPHTYRRSSLYNRTQIIIILTGLQCRHFFFFWILYLNCRRSILASRKIKCSMNGYKELNYIVYQRRVDECEYMEFCLNRIRVLEWLRKFGLCIEEVYIGVVASFRCTFM